MVENPNMKFGEAEVKTDGAVRRLVDVKYKMGGLTRKSLDNGMGFVHTRSDGTLSGKMYLSAGESIEEIRALGDVTLVWSLDTGQVYTAAHAWLEGDPEPSSDGFDVEFRFKNATEVTNG